MDSEESLLLKVRPPEPMITALANFHFHRLTSSFLSSKDDWTSSRNMATFNSTLVSRLHMQHYRLCATDVRKYQMKLSVQV